MRDELEAGTMLIRGGTPSPEAMGLECEPYMPGWCAVKNICGAQLERKFGEAGWSFFYLAGELKAVAVGARGQQTLRRAVKHLLAGLKTQRFNALEITSVVWKSFLGIPYSRVSAHARHIQKDGVLLIGRVAEPLTFRLGIAAHRAMIPPQ